MKPTVRQIALASGVSVATVSRALNDKDSVNEETKRRVIDIARQLGYEMSQKPRPIQGKVAVVFSKEDSYYIGQQEGKGVRWCFDEDVYGGVEAAATEADYQVHLVLYRHEENGKLPASLSMVGLVGCLLVGGSVHPYLVSELRKCKLPLVSVGIEVASDISAVVADNQNGMRNVVRYLHKTGRRRIALINGPEHRYTSGQKLAGYQLGLLEGGLGIDPDLIIHGELSYSDGYNSGRRLIDKGVDAIACAYDALALGVSQAAMERGVSVPEGLAVVGYGDEMNKSPRIPTVAVPKEEMGRIAFERLLEISNEPTRKRTVVTVDTELVPVIDKD